MADSSDEVKQQPQPDESAQRHATRSMDPRYQRNFAERLFPGPSKPMSDQVQRRIEGLLKALDATQQAGQRREKHLGQDRGSQDRVGQGSTGDRSALETRGASAPAPAAAALPSNVATSDDIAQLHDSLEQQNELLRAILASQVDSQNDARSTAQNSRTFAWAGTAIAVLTLVATVLSIIAAINAS